MSSKPILYSYFRSSCSWRVRNVLELKCIDYEYRAINLLKKEQAGEEYRMMNPMGRVPTFQENGKILTQSVAIMEYLDEKYPSVRLLPADSFLKAKTREVVETIASGTQPFQNLNVLAAMGDKKGEWAESVIAHGFRSVEKILEEFSGKYCIGDSVTLADCCLVPQVYNASRFGVNMDEFPNISRINQTLLELPAFKKAHYKNMPDCTDDLK